MPPATPDDDDSARLPDEGGAPRRPRGVPASPPMTPAPPLVVVLLGLRASGKSSVGAALARRLGAEFVDLDDRTRERLGAATVAEAFAAAGESRFREAEAFALAEALADPQLIPMPMPPGGAAPSGTGDGVRVGAPIGDGDARRLHVHRVLALGGGTPMGEAALEALETAQGSGRAYLVLLDPPIEVLAARLRRDAGGRPSLTGRGVVEEIPEIAAARRPRYAALADFVLRESDAVEKLAARIADRLSAVVPTTGSGAAGRSQR